MIADKNRIYDGFESLEAGVDAGRSPHLIDPNQAAEADNMTFRGGQAAVRPGFRKLTEIFTNPEHSYFSNGIDAAPQVVAGLTAGPSGDPSNPFPGIYKTGIMQCFTGFSPHKGEECLMAMIDGRLFKIIPGVNTASVTEIAPITDETSPFTFVRGGQDGFINPAALNYFDSHTAAFTQNDVGAILQCTKFPHNRSAILEVINSVRVRLSDSANSGGSNLPFFVLGKDKAYRNRSDVPQCFMVQADKWLFVQDGFSKCIIYDGATARRSNSDETDPEKTEIPVGTIMAYGMGRVVVVVIDRDIAFGDLYGSHISPDPADSLPFFTERNFIAEGFDAAIPFQMGVATGMVFFPQLDTSTGLGQLLVFAERGAASFNLAIPRDQWKTSQFQTLALLTTGLRGDRSISVVNEDLWFRSDDGVRSFRQARSEPGLYLWTHIPLSTNVRQFLDADTESILKFSNSIYFDNRIIGTCSPYINVSTEHPYGRPFHNGLVVVDFDIVSSFGVKNRPAWDGHWQKMRITQLCTAQFGGVTRAFAFGLDEQPDPSDPAKTILVNQLYELSVDDRDDWDGPIDWSLVTRTFGFKGQSTPFNENELYDGDIWIRDIATSQTGQIPIPPAQT